MEKNGGTSPGTPGSAPDLTKSQTTAQSVGSKAGAYMSSWASWAGEKRRSGWGKAVSTTPSPTLKSHAWSRTGVVPDEFISEKKRSVELSNTVPPSGGAVAEPLSRPRTQESFQESIFDAGSIHGSEKDSTEEPTDRALASESSKGSTERATELETPLAS